MRRRHPRTEGNTMSNYREESEKAKALRREPAPDKMANVPSKTRRPRPVMRWGVFREKVGSDPLAALYFGFQPWQKFETKEQAEEWVEKRLRSVYVPEGSTETYQERIKIERARWSIKELK
jgi:hypothetical protein